jgi:hypothetical protein
LPSSFSKLELDLQKKVLYVDGPVPKPQGFSVQRQHGKMSELPDQRHNFLSHYIIHGKEYFEIGSMPPGYATYRVLVRGAGVCSPTQAQVCLVERQRLIDLGVSHQPEEE